MIRLDEKIIDVNNLPDKYYVKYRYIKNPKFIQNTNPPTQIEYTVFRNDDEPVFRFISNSSSLLTDPLYVKQNDCEFIITSMDNKNITIINLTYHNIKDYKVNIGEYSTIGCFKWIDFGSILEVICVSLKAVVFTDVNLYDPSFECANNIYYYKLKSIKIIN